MSWPKGKSRKPKPEQQPAADGEREPGLIDPVELLDPAESQSKTPSASKSKPHQTKAKTQQTRAQQQAKAQIKAAEDTPRKPWVLRKDDLVKRLKADARDIEWQDYSGDISTHIDPEKLRNIRHEYGAVLQWCTETVLGKDFPERMINYERNGWVRLEPGDFGIDVVRLDGLVLCARSVTLDNRRVLISASKRKDRLTTSGNSWVKACQCEAVIIHRQRAATIRSGRPSSD